MIKNTYFKIRVSEEELFKIEENASRAGYEKVSQYVLAKLLGAEQVPGGKPNIDEDTLQNWRRVGEGIHEYLAFRGKSLESFVDDLIFRSVRKGDPVAWGAYLVGKVEDVKQENAPVYVKLPEE